MAIEKDKIYKKDNGEFYADIYYETEEDPNYKINEDNEKYVTLAELMDKEELIEKEVEKREISIIEREIDSDTSDIQDLFNNLIDKTGIIEELHLTFKKIQTPEILETLTKQKILYENTRIKWNLTKHENKINLNIYRK